ncbi:MmcQ/YjbR family DNA-binding protein [Streptomyces hoynatensis]|uniref:MmcQ/YjbR family DNA-binding protein n=1 Tax=Streptomyces hoynatensis TaxID=1141874 RepID=A0A3A9Z6A3_9ACTN|nr:MmcQ/YjbR family DNA-binding protein [Streptomyces hoynatensis]RKN43901.1 MmcQ/YjbR family DNA-binding protein [Streptomyces hoynatensis]
MWGVEDLREWVNGLPEVEEATHFGQPSFKVKGRPFAGIERDGTTAVAAVAQEEAARAVAEDPEHYAEVWRPGGPHGRIFVGLRVELAAVSGDRLRELVVRAWRHKAPKRVVAAYDAGR